MVDGGTAPVDRLHQLIECAAAADPELALAGSSALFQILAEGLADLFEPALSDAYADIFSLAIAAVLPELDPAALVERHRRVRNPQPFRGDFGCVKSVFVLSRVTLGADIAITSLMLDAAKRCFPDASVYLASAEKNWKLFAADPRLHWLPVSYGRLGTLRDRLSIGRELTTAFSRPNSIVIDPDSRLTQLGMLPVCPEENYYFFDSRAYGADGDEPLTALTRRWIAETFGLPDASPFMALLETPVLPGTPFVTVNLGVGDNPAKRVGDPFEEELLRALVRKRAPVVVDLGAGGEEEERVRKAISRSGAGEQQVRPWRGSFAAFAAMIAASRLYVGYDSGGQHAAAACGTPLLTVFAGFASPRMFARWRPTGPGPKEVVRVERSEPRAVLEQTLSAVERLIPGPVA